MAFENVGAYQNGSDVPTKTALKAAFRDLPEEITLYATSEFKTGQTTWSGDDLDKSLKYSVCGPNPYTSRKWYATVAYNTKTDKWTVS